LNKFFFSTMTCCPPSLECKIKNSLVIFLTSKIFPVSRYLRICPISGILTLVTLLLSRPFRRPTRWATCNPLVKFRFSQNLKSPHKRRTSTPRKVLPVRRISVQSWFRYSEGSPRPSLPSSIFYSPPLVGFLVYPIPCSLANYHFPTLIVQE